MPLWQSLLNNHILPSIFDAAASLLLVLVIFKLFRVKNPATRFMFLFVPLLKPFIVLLDSTSTVTQLRRGRQPLQIALHMPDPLNLITSPIREASTIAVTHDQSALFIAVVIAIIAIAILLVARWMQLFLFLNKFKKEEVLSKSEFPFTYETLDKLTARFDTKRPKLVLTDKSHFVPFSIGYKVPIIVLSRDLLRTFPREQLEIMLAHELAHIRRKDSLIGWISLMLRDIMFFNPLTRLAYRMLEEEKEKACDRVAIEKAGLSPNAIANTLLDIALFYKKFHSSRKSLNLALSSGLFYRKSTLERRIQSITNPATKKKPSKVRTTLKIILFVLLVYVQPTLFVNLNGQLFFLR